VTHNSPVEFPKRFFRQPAKTLRKMSEFLSEIMKQIGPQDLSNLGFDGKKLKWRNDYTSSCRYLFKIDSALKENGLAREAVQNVSKQKMATFRMLRIPNHTQLKK
jgi:hypothetical protein